MITFNQLPHLNTRHHLSWTESNRNYWTNQVHGHLELWWSASKVRLRRGSTEPREYKAMYYRSESFCRPDPARKKDKIRLNHKNMTEMSLSAMAQTVQSEYGVLIEKTFKRLIKNSLTFASKKRFNIPSKRTNFHQIHNWAIINGHKWSCLTNAHDERGLLLSLNWLWRIMSP